MRADMVPSGLSTVIRMTKVRPSSVTLRRPATAPIAARRRGSLSSAGRPVRAGAVAAVACCGLGGGASKVEMPVLHRSRRPLQDFHGLLHRRLLHVDLLEAARQRVILFEHAAEFGVGGRADALQLAD